MDKDDLWELVNKEEIIYKWYDLVGAATHE